MQVDYQVPPAELQRIPKCGPLVVVANHPFGGIEGLILAAVLQQVRPDVKLLANYMLKCIPELRDICFFVDPFGGRDSTSRNIASIKAALRWVRGGGLLAVFPAGEVAHLKASQRRITDPPWNDSIARLIMRSSAAVMPVYFSGRNSNLFQAAGLLHPRLRTALLPREFLRMRGRAVKLRLGRLINRQRIDRFDNPAELTTYVRVRTYLLKGQAEVGHKHTAGIVHGQEAADALGRPQPPAVVEEEIAALAPNRCMVEIGSFRVFCAPASEIPSALREIGRLRELTFRLAGEGTGRPLDLDRFDQHYLHLFVWNEHEREIAGAYRIGQTDEILSAHGIDGLYTATLFEFKPALLKQISPALELGRSFVVPDYQKNYIPLMAMWKGIGNFLAANLRYRHLLGAVSISDDYHSTTKQLLMAFLKHNNYRSDLASLVKPRTPPCAPPQRDSDPRLIAPAARSLDEVDELVREIEADGKPLPVLLRQHLRLGGKLLGFNVDTSFGNVLDGLMLVDLLDVNRTILAQYMGQAAATRFLDHHAPA